MKTGIARLSKRNLNIIVKVRLKDVNKSKSHSYFINIENVKN